MKIAISIAIGVIVVAFHLWASRRTTKYWYLGGIVPVAWIILLAVQFYNKMITFAEDWRRILFPTLILFLMWAEGHEAAKKKEAAKMKAKDLT